MFHDGETETNALRLAVHFRSDAIETFEDALVLISRNSSATIFHPKKDLRRGKLQSDRDDALVRRMFDGVVDQIDKQTLQGAAIGFDGLRRATVHLSDADATLGTIRLHQQDGLIHQRNEIGVYGNVMAWMQRSLFPAGHPYVRPVGGSPASLRGLTLADARAFAAAHYRPAAEVFDDRHITVEVPFGSARPRPKAV